MKPSIFAAGCALFLLTFARGAKAQDTFDVRSIVTFSNPVEIPGQMLPAGTYVFKMSPDPLQKDVVWIFNATESRLIATEITLPVIHWNPPDTPVIQLDESRSGEPPRLHEFAFPGIIHGHEFVYNSPVRHQ
jgi:hypothetical protein